MNRELVDIDIVSGSEHCACVIYADDIDVFSEANVNAIPSTLKSGFRIASAGDSGLGMFSGSEGFEVGDLIWKEHPTIVIPVEAIPNVFSNVYGRLPALQQQSLMELRNAHPSGVDPVEGRMRTNFIGIELSQSTSRSYRALFPIISRANHSCSSNATYHFDVDSFSLELRAARPIEADEEIHIQYIDTLCVRSERKKSLRELYMFDCQCPTCGLPDDSPLASESDFRRIRIRDWSDWHPSFESWLYDHDLPDGLIMGQCVELLELMYLEGLECMQRFALDMICAALAACGIEDDYRAWALKAKEAARMGGDRHPMVLHYEKTIRDPKSSRLWNARNEEGET